MIYVCIREDCESEQENIDDFYEKIKQNYNIRKVSTVITSPVVLRKRIGELQKSWETFANAEITITDRLHAMLFSVLNGTPCIVLNNKRASALFNIYKYMCTKCIYWFLHGTSGN